MKRDSIFYKLFQQAPTAIFELLKNPPENAEKYRFDSVAVKEPRFEIDGVFLPPENEEPGVVYFCEVQFQYDPTLYERIFAETSLYFYRNSVKFSDWQVIVIYPSRNIEQDKIFPHRSFLNGEQVHRIHLDELGKIEELPIWVALMVLTIVQEDKAPETARNLLQRSNEQPSLLSNRAIIEMITTIMVYKFEKLSPREVESMLGITLQQTRVYREIKEEGREEGLEQGLEQGKIGEAVNLVMRLLTKKFGQISPENRSFISGLSLPVLEDLSEALLDFNHLNDLQIWLDNVKTSK
jgi:predicted transposase/invertase (TIGR01784 family)